MHVLYVKLNCVYQAFSLCVAMPLWHSENNPKQTVHSPLQTNCTIHRSQIAYIFIIISFQSQTMSNIDLSLFKYDWCCDQRC